MLNKAQIIGRLGKDPEVRYTQGGDAVATLSIATSERWKDKQSGEPQERTEWHRCVFFGKPAEILGEHARKGGLMYVEGQLRTRKWQDQSGQDRYTTEINGREFKFLSRSDSEDKEERAPQRQADPQPSPPPRTAPTAQPAEGEFLDDDTIPF